MKLTIPFLFLLLFLAFACRQPEAVKKDLSQLLEEYWEEYEGLGIPAYDLAYRENLKSIPGPDTLHLQRMFFQNIQRQLLSIESDSLGRDELLEYRLFEWQVGFHLERLELEERFLITQRNKPISRRGLINVELGREWYKHYIKRWLSEGVSPEDLYAFGRNQIKQAQQQIRRIQQTLGYADDSTSFYQYLDGAIFVTEDSAAVLKEFDQLRTIVRPGIDQVFAAYPEAVLSDSAELAFQHNIYEQAFNRRNLEWLFLHELIPGHLFESRFDRPELPLVAPFRSRTRSLYPAYIEGWAAYAEGLGSELGLYTTPESELGRWEWDIVRSVRVVMDVGINYLGWTNREALKFWKQEIVHRDEIAMREIRRIRERPAQVLTYQYGAAQITDIREQLKEQEGGPFDLRNFHQKILAPGAMPLWLLKEVILEKEEETL